MGAFGGKVVEYLGDFAEPSRDKSPEMIDSLINLALVLVVPPGDVNCPH